MLFDWIVFVIFIGLIYLSNKWIVNSSIKLLINMLFLSESVVLLFFFDKSSLIFSLLIFLISSYYIVFNTTFINVNINQNLFSNSNYFRAIGFFLIFIVIVYEYFAGFTWSTNDLLILILASIFLFYDKIPSSFYQERDLLLFFFMFISVFLVFPDLLNNFLPDIKIFNFWYSSTELIHIFLGIPLSNLLNLLGYNTSLVSDTIFFENKQTGLYTGVQIAKSCAGIRSVQIFISLLLSYIFVIYRKFDYFALGIIILGTLTAYLSNLIRMSIIVITGHYFGIERMLEVHEYAGWLIFTLSLFIFSSLLANIVEIDE